MRKQNSLPGTPFFPSRLLSPSHFLASSPRFFATAFLPPRAARRAFGSARRSCGGEEKGRGANAGVDNGYDDMNEGKQEGENRTTGSNGETSGELARVRVEELRADESNSQLRARSDHSMRKKDQETPNELQFAHPGPRTLEARHAPETKTPRRPLGQERLAKKGRGRGARPAKVTKQRPKEGMERPRRADAGHAPRTHSAAGTCTMMTLRKRRKDKPKTLIVDTREVWIPACAKYICGTLTSGEDAKASWRTGIFVDFLQLDTSFRNPTRCLNTSLPSPFSSPTPARSSLHLPFVIFRALITSTPNIIKILRTICHPNKPYKEPGCGGTARQHTTGEASWYRAVWGSTPPARIRTFASFYASDGYFLLPFNLITAFEDPNRVGLTDLVLGLVVYCGTNPTQKSGVVYGKPPGSVGNSSSTIASGTELDSPGTNGVGIWPFYDGIYH
ncbi:hypothetical protein K438DRAFT_1765276 [Mycena galopus ATCC 62051]|nr:hypothetical protein K438DRAFT_1765276 [Mycena galopus ATCC 62051]